jgi:hypothetical protein
MHVITILELCLIVTAGALGLASWNTGGRRVVLVAVMLATAWLSSALWASGGLARYLSSAAFLSLLIVCVATVRRDTWHKLRVELLLGTTAVLAIVASVLVPGAHASLVLVDLAAVLGAAFIVITIVRSLRMFIPGLRVRK